MNTKRILYIGLILIGAVSAFLNGWVFLLNGEIRSLLFAGLGILIVIAGIVNLRRERSAS